MAAVEFNRPPQATGSTSIRPFEDSIVGPRAWATNWEARGIGWDGGMAATVKRSGGRFLRDLVHFEAG